MATMGSHGSTIYGFRSEKDPRFRGGGRSTDVLLAERKIDELIAELEGQYGVPAPDDVEIWALGD